jgi:phage repressor protein C with HTH and peptisase S24 domain
MDKSLILKEMIKYYNFKNDGEFATLLGISNQTLSNWKARKTFDAELIYTKCVIFKAEWLLTGKLPMLNNDLNKVSESSVIYEREQKKLIPLYDGVITAGMQETAVLESTKEPAEMIDAGDWFRDATAAMRVHGDSMYPEYKSGSIAALREVQNKRLVVYGQDYLIETTEYRVIKRLQKSELPQNWLACSVNEEKYESSGRLIHEPFDVRIDDVVRIYQVLGNVKRNQSTTVVHTRQAIKKNKSL